jgi:hypothetical protein
MSVAAALTSPALLGAMTVYLLAVLGWEGVVARLAPHMAQHGFTDWLLEHVYVPLGRAACIALFVLVAYPGIFGLTEAPPLSQVLGGEQRVSMLVNLAFTASLLLPLVPLLGEQLALVLPAQAMALSALLLDWTAGAMGVEVALWPGGDVMLAILLLVAVSGPIARAVARLVAFIREQDEAPWMVETALLLLQLPAILIYTLRVSAPLRG